MNLLRFGSLCSLLVLLPFEFAFAIRHADNVVSVETGMVQGTESIVPGVRVFKGIPFAQPPVGELRWRPPQPPLKWSGTRNADKFSDSCIQNLRRSSNPWTAEFMVQNNASEDCLCLNVWTASKGSGKRPVFVWIHGGGFNEGSGEVAVYDGAELARKGLVVVTINYRVGPLGFLAHPELSKESRNNASGNYGLLDALAALVWIKKNIAAFEGDPQRVTIAGQSAGAFAVHALMASPLAANVFHRAIAESGSSVDRRTRNLADAQNDGVKFVEAKGKKSISELRALPASEFTSGSGIRFSPVVDGWVLPADVSAIFAQGRQNDVPVITGLTADEGSASSSYGKLKPEEFRKQAEQRFGDIADKFLKLYPSEDETRSTVSQKQAARDQGMIAMHLWAAERARTSKAKAWTYYFSRPIPWPEHPQYAAFHTSEVPYVFGNLKLLNRPWERIDRELSERMMAYWVNFATNGDPNGRGLPAWPSFDPAKRSTMELNEKPGPRQIADDDRFAFFERHFAR